MISENSATNAVVCPDSDIVIAGLDGLRQQLLALVASGIKEITVDLCHVTLIDSSGIGCLIATHNQLKQAGGTLRVKNASADIARLFSIMRLNRHIEIVA